MHRVTDIVPPSRRRESEQPASRPAAAPSGEGPRPPAGRERTFPYVTVLAAALVVAGSIVALFYFSSAKIEIVPRAVSVDASGSFSASKNSGDLPFELITSSKVATKSVKASGAKAVSSAASGTIIIYNQKSSTQKLIANTRFATASGLIFRIHSAVTVPGGSSTKPGSISAKAYADQPGSTYNIAPTSFTVPGLAGTPQADKVYARSTSAMTGGASGNEPVVDASAETQARKELETALAPDLSSSLSARVPSGYMLLPGATVTSYEALSSESSSEAGMAVIREQGTATAVVFPSAALARAVVAAARERFPNYQNEPLSFAGAGTLALSHDGALPSAEAESFSFTLSGSATLVYTIDPARIATAASGKTLDAARTALDNYPEVGSARMILRPFWRHAFPEDPASISVTVLKP